MASDGSPYREFTPERIKHLEMIQAVIARLGGNGFLVRGWAVTIVGALLGLAVNGKDGGLAYLALVPVGAFWVLDTHQLRAERLFRSLFNQVRKNDPAIEPFWMAATSKAFVAHLAAGDRRACSWGYVALRPVLAGLYVPLAVAAIVVGIIVG
jgi:hypothetical protein